MITIVTVIVRMVTVIVTVTVIVKIVTIIVIVTTSGDIRIYYIYKNMIYIYIDI